MLHKLRGILDSIEDDLAILDVSGVGYGVYCSARTLAAFPGVGEIAQLVIETHVREDHIHLYGFPDTVEREWFRLLATVQRVGNKMALAILGTYAPDQIAHAILARDTAAFSRISGVGPKLAERIVTELKDKVSKLPTSSLGAQPHASASRIAHSQSSHMGDAASALINLGYGRSEAYSAASRAAQAHAGASLDELIRLSLKELAPA